MLAFDKHVLDTQAHKLVLPWWYRIVPYRSYVKSWKISTSHYINQDLSTIWLSPPHCGKCSTAPHDGQKHADVSK